MSEPAASRGRATALALGAFLLAAFVLWRWAAAPAPSPPVSIAVATPVIGLRTRASAESSHRTRHPSDPTPAEGSGAAPPNPRSFDFGTMTPRVGPTASDTDERFALSDRFTKDDLDHPERYFEQAERVPELNRPEERRDALEFFLAYRKKLARDLEDAKDDPNRQREIAAVAGRYDAAIARLRALIGGAEAR